MTKTPGRMKHHPGRRQAVMTHNDGNGREDQVILPIKPGAGDSSTHQPGDNFSWVLPTLLTLWATGEEGTSHEHIREPSRRKR
jgi:hypothetical protein